MRFVVVATLSAVLLSACTTGGSASSNEGRWTLDVEPPAPSELAFVQADEPAVDDCDATTGDSSIGEVTRALTNANQGELSARLLAASRPIAANAATPDQLAELAGALSEADAALSDEPTPRCQEIIASMATRLGELGFGDRDVNEPSLHEQLVASYDLDEQIADCAAAALEADDTATAAGSAEAELALLQAVSGCANQVS